MISIGPPPKRRRRRPARSCEQCRRRKVRCDQEQPCGGCVRARASMTCTYRDESPGDATAVSDRPLESQSPIPQSRVDDGVSRPAIGAVNHDIATGDPRNQHQPLAQRGDKPPAPEQDTSNPPKDPYDSSYASSCPSSSIPPVIPRLRNVPEKTKLFGQTHWLHTAEKFPVSGSIHPIEVEPNFIDAKAELLEALGEARNLRFAMKSLHKVKLEEPIRDIISTLPSKKACDVLIHCYFRTLEPLYRIIHVPSFWRDYDRVWEPQPAAPIPTVFMIKLSLVLSIGTTFYSTVDDAELKQLRQLAQTWIQNAQWWLTGPSEKATYTHEGLQVCCLLLLARQTTFNCFGATSWLSAVSLMRMAITMGLHRNSTLFPTLTPFHRELRARLWATVLELCVQSCLDLALPLNFDPNDYDSSLLSNFNDSDLDSNSQNLAVPANKFTDSSLQILLVKSLPLRMTIVRLLNDFRTEQSYERTLTLGAEIRVACREVAAFFHAYNEAEHDSDDGSVLKPTAFHRKLLDIHLRRFTMFLHRDFMLQARADPRFYLSRKSCVEAAMVIASSSKGAGLTQPLKDWDDMSRLSLVGRGVFKCSLSFDATLILALEVVTQLDDESAPCGEADALDEIAKAARAPLIHVLEETRDQLMQQIIKGNTSLKRFLFVEAHLAQIQAMESGRPIKNAVYETANKTLQKCVSVMRGHWDAATPRESVEMMDPMTMDFSPMDMLPDGTEFNWDISNLLCFSTVNELGQVQWPA